MWNVGMCVASWHAGRGLRSAVTVAQSAVAVSLPSVPIRCRGSGGGSLSYHPAESHHSCRPSRVIHASFSVVLRVAACYVR